MNKPFPHLWFDKEAKQAAELYTSLFPDSKITHASTLEGTPSGDTDIVSFELAGQPFMAISAGPVFKFNPSISFHARCTSDQEVDRLWEALAPGGQVLMPLAAYPWSKRYGWLQDRFGLSWQIMSMGVIPDGQMIVPALTFVGAQCGKAAEAMTFYTSLFADSSIVTSQVRGADAAPEREGTMLFGECSLSGYHMVVMDSALDHKFAFNEAISFLVQCDTQEEIDGLWSKLSAVPEAEQCGWLKDKFGVSWQIAPTAMNSMMASGDPKKIQAVTAAFMKMKKFDIAALQAAFDAN